MCYLGKGTRAAESEFRHKYTCMCTLLYICVCKCVQIPVCVSLGEGCCLLIWKAKRTICRLTHLYNSFFTWIYFKLLTRDKRHFKNHNKRIKKATKDKWLKIACEKESDLCELMKDWIFPIHFHTISSFLGTSMQHLQLQLLL